MKKFIAILLCVLLLYPAGFTVARGPDRIDTARELIDKSYLDLLELDQIQTFSRGEIRSAETQLNKAKELEQGRLEKEEHLIEKELKAARNRVDELNKKGSRDSEHSSTARFCALKPSWRKPEPNAKRASPSFIRTSLQNSI